jgi:hypothetical protein
MRCMEAVPAGWLRLDADATLARDRVQAVVLVRLAPCERLGTVRALRCGGVEVLEARAAVDDAALDALDELLPRSALTRSCLADRRFSRGELVVELHRHMLSCCWSCCHSSGQGAQRRHEPTERGRSCSAQSRLLLALRRAVREVWMDQIRLHRPEAPQVRALRRWRTRGLQREMVEVQLR